MQLGVPCSFYGNYMPRVWTVGDSITVGVGAATLPAWRSTLYSAFAGSIRMVGSQSYGGTPDVLGVNAANEGHNGQTIVQLTNGSIIGGTEIYKPDIVTCLFGINDIITDGASAPTVLSRMSTALDQLWARRSVGWMQIMLCSILKNLTVSPNYDATVQLVNAGQAAMVASKSYRANVTVVPAIYSSIQAQFVGVGGGYNDPTHPNDTGYGVGNMGTAMATAITPLVRIARPRP